MEMITKTIIRLGIGAAIISALFVFWVASMFSGMCGNYIHSQTASPDKKYEAVIFQRDCGATTGFSTQVSIIKLGSELDNEPGNIFSISGHPEKVAPELVWIDEKTLHIKHNVTGNEYLLVDNFGWFDKLSIKYGK